MAEIKFEITKQLGVIAESTKGWKKEVNMVSWNDRAPKLDIREWDLEHEKMGKGITLNNEEIKKLRDILCDLELN
ncbi:MAG: PC4/YdbC family ssDNA-binding protein [Clostridia bacterium]